MKKTKVIQIAGGNLRELKRKMIRANRLSPDAIWHYGMVIGLGFFSTAGGGGREVLIQWEDETSRQQGGLSDEDWEIFKLAFAGSGRIAILSDLPNPQWKFDYRFLEAQRP